METGVYWDADPVSLQLTQNTCFCDINMRNERMNTCWTFPNAQSKLDVYTCMSGT